MSAIIETGRTLQQASFLPLLSDANLERPLLSNAGRHISARDFLRDVRAVAGHLPKGKYAVNLCEDRYRFLVSFCAVAIQGQTNLLPSSRVKQAIDDVMQAYPSSYTLSERTCGESTPRHFVLPPLPAHDEVDQEMPSIAADHVVAIGFTSGSTGQPKANPKLWRSVCASSARNAALLGALDTACNIVATVPPQHMYGLEMSVLLPLRSRATIDVDQPFFPADIAHALQKIEAPRVLVTTPFHLRALLQARVAMPAIAAIVSATAPLDGDIARAAEKVYSTRVIEVFGSTETCVIAHRRAALDEPWKLYDGVALRPQPDGTLVEAAYFSASTSLQDIVELLPDERFVLRGRNGDLLDIAGKRASLGDLNHRLLAIPGVTDGVMFTLDADRKGVRRLAALVVAKDLSELDIVESLRCAIDPVFLPRIVRLVEALPRNATGKLPREALIAALRG
ncbi:MAG TPA: AMP-binding protein [Rudaea sp.]|nr:AMP-binding protein [Rudaea sp.]